MREYAFAEYLKHANEIHECLKKRMFNEMFPRGAVSGPNADRNRLLFPSQKLYLMPPPEAVKKRPAWRTFMKGKERSGADDCSGASDRLIRERVW